jgi:L-asparaginase II
VGKSPTPIHNNCSGKHAGMLATVVHLGLDPRGYERPEHMVQQEIRRVISEVCDVTLEQDEIGIDGCSVPTFALPLAAVATGFARLASGRGLDAERAKAARRLLDACFAAPDLVARGPLRHHRVMRGPQTRLAKGGAEGVHAPRCRRWGLALPSRSTTAPSGARRSALSVLLGFAPGAEHVPEGQLAGDAHLAWREGGRGRPIACAQGRGPRLAASERCCSSAALIGWG